MSDLITTLTCPAIVADGTPCDAPIVLAVGVDEAEPMTRDYPGTAERIYLDSDLPRSCSTCGHEYTVAEMEEMSAEAESRMDDHAFDGLGEDREPDDYEPRRRWLPYGGTAA